MSEDIIKYITRKNVFFSTHKIKKPQLMKFFAARNNKNLGVGRLIVTIVQASISNATNSNPPYCEATMGQQCHTTKPAQVVKLSNYAIFPLSFFINCILKGLNLYLKFNLILCLPYISQINELKISKCIILFYKYILKTRILQNNITKIKLFVFTFIFV